MPRYQIEYTLSHDPTRTELKEHIEKVATKIHADTYSHYIIDSNKSFSTLRSELKDKVKGKFDSNKAPTQNVLVVAEITEYHSLEGDSDNLDWKKYTA